MLNYYKCDTIEYMIIISLISGLLLGIIVVLILEVRLLKRKISALSEFLGVCFSEDDYPHYCLSDYGFSKRIEKLLEKSGDNKTIFN